MSVTSQIYATTTNKEEEVEEEEKKKKTRVNESNKKM